jgi:hypothetical protein
MRAPWPPMTTCLPPRGACLSLLGRGGDYYCSQPYDHPIKAYLVCEMHDCDARVSASHAEISIPWHNIPHGEQLKKLHRALPSELVLWTCPKCDLE